MLARLARWLRVLGYDTASEPDWDDAELVALAADEGRVLLTRDRHLVTHLRPAQSLLITEDDPLEQLREVADACELAPLAELFTRCLVCNAALRPATAEAAAARFPERDHPLPAPVRCCPECRRLYWRGSHTRRMREALARAFPDWFS